MKYTACLAPLECFSENKAKYKARIPVFQCVNRDLFQSLIDLLRCHLALGPWQLTVNSQRRPRTFLHQALRLRLGFIRSSLLAFKLAFLEPQLIRPPPKTLVELIRKENSIKRGRAGPPRGSSISDSLVAVRYWGAPWQFDIGQLPCSVAAAAA
jgi:hypothetical protein